MSRFHHLAHLLKPPLVTVGTYVKRGQIIGYVGNTGNSTGPHCHYEVWLTKPPTWWVYTQGLNIAQVKARYTNPLPWIKDNIPCPLSYVGSGFGVWTRNGIHPGIDINSPNDLGKPVRSPVNGRVHFIEGEKFIRNWLGRLVPSFFNRGWGNHIWIEEDHANASI